MIITKSWINEFIDIEKEDFKKVEATLNSIGHEVATVETIEIPPKVVVGKVLSCEPHPDADKLSVCKVDIGPEEVQIVCGAKNVREGLYVAAATLGAKLPNGMEMKPVKLRGVESLGMLCGSTEIGMPKMNDGIMELDDSIGRLVVGKELREYETLNDTVIEVELTANRGDCLSINGLSRELCAANSYNKRTVTCNIDDDNAKGIGRVLQVDFKSGVTASAMYKVVETEKICSNFLTDFRTALIGKYSDSEIERILAYSTHATGVLLHAYDFDFFYDPELEKADIRVISEDGLNKIKCNKKNKASLVGIRHVDEAMAKADSKMIILEAAYVDADEISKQVHDERIETDDQFYRASRGSEPELESGICHICDTIGKKSQAIFYSEKIQNKLVHKQTVLHCRLDEINALIGRSFEKIEINNILKRLGMEVKATPEQNTLMVSIPKFRHDIYSSADIIEEIVRMVGIDNIDSKPLETVETIAHNEDYARYKAQYEVTLRSVAQGFFQTLHFAFENSKNNDKYGLVGIKPSLELLNPITAELDTMRISLLPGLIESVQNNIYKSRKSVALFEIGTCFDKDRNEYKKAAFAWAGHKEGDDVLNHGKPADIDFKSFLQKLKAIFPKASFVENTHKAGYIHPYMSGDIVVDGKVIGFAAKMHPKTAAEMDLPSTFIAEVNLDAMDLTLKQAVPTSKFQRSQRDMSVVIGKNIAFTQIKEAIDALKITELKELYPSDFYYDEKMGDRFSLTLRFTLQSSEDVLSEERSNAIFDAILETLKTTFQAELR